MNPEAQALADEIKRDLDHSFINANDIVKKLDRLAAMSHSAEQTRSQKLASAGFTRRPSLWAMRAREALQLIAAPMRPDGTWNRDREVCRQIAAEALGRYDDNEPTPPARVALSEHRSRFEKWWLGRGGTRPSLYVTPAGEYEDADVAFHWGIWMGINGITQAQGAAPSTSTSGETQ